MKFLKYMLLAIALMFGAGAAHAQVGPLPCGGISSFKTYRPDVSYPSGAIVIEWGASYQSQYANNIGNDPCTTPSAWSTTIGTGPQGPAGAAGPTGAQGPAGVGLPTPTAAGQAPVSTGTTVGSYVPTPVSSTAFTVARQTYVLDDYLSVADGHSGTDYGYAATAFCAAIGCSTLQTPVGLKTTAQGTCRVYTTINLPGPIQFDASSCSLVPQSTMANAYVSLSSCTTTMGSSTVTCASTSGLAVGMAIAGDATLGPANYVASVTNSTTFTLALPAFRNMTAVITPASATVTGVDSLQDVVVGQTWNNIYFAGGTTISSIAYGATKSVVMSTTATSGSAVPLTLTLNTGTAVSGLSLKAVAQTPVIAVIEAPNALKKPHGPNFDASMSNVIINDPNYSFANNSFGRSQSGVIGVKIFGYDNYKIEGLSINGLDGSGLVLGGYVSSANDNGAVRESDFSKVYIYSCGDKSTGQPSLAIMTGLGSNSFNAGNDEINQIGWNNLHIINPDSDNLVIGTYSHSGNNGPRLMWFNGDTQFEGGISPYYFGNSDVVRILIGGKTIRFNGGEYVTPGFGKSTFKVNAGTDLGITGGNIGSAGGVASVYNVTIANGSPTVTYVSQSSNGSTVSFPAAQYLNGIGALLNDGASCTPCTVWLTPTNSVNSGGTQITLAANYTGAATTATLTLNTGGYTFNLEQASALNNLSVMNNTYSTVGSTVGTMLGANLTTELYLAGQNAINPPQVITDYPNTVGIQAPITLGPSTALAGGTSQILNFADWYPNASAVQTQSSVQLQLYSGTGNNPTQQLYLKCVICANDFYNNLQNNASGFGIQQNLTSTGANKATFGTFGSSQGWSWGMNNSVNWSLRDTTNSNTNVMVVTPLTEAVTYSGNQTAPGFYQQSLAAGPNASFFDDFFGAGNLTFNSFGTGPSGNSGGLAGQHVDLNHSGMFRLVSGTVASTGEYGIIGALNQNAIFTPNTAPGWTWESAVYPEVLPGTTAGAYEIGFANATNVSPWTTGIGFYLSSTNSVANDYYCQYAGTLVDSTVAATSAWTRLTMVQNGTNLLWYINGVQKCSVAIASLPSASVSMGWNAFALTTSSMVLDADYVTFQRVQAR